MSARILIALLTAAAGLCLAAEAGAKEPRFALRFEAPATNGYTLSFTAHTGGEVAHVVVGRESRRVATEVHYRVTAKKATRRRIVAEFGEFGTIDLRFDPRRKVEEPYGCPPTIRGTFRGTIDFTGDGGFTTVQASSAKGAIRRGGFLPPEPCFLGGDGGLDRPQPSHDFVFLLACRPPGALQYAAIEGLSRDQVHVAELSERVGRVSIRRWRFALGESATFTYSREGRWARVRPPEPFTGSAKLRAGRLRGDLAAPFPGIVDPVPLTPMRAGIRSDPDCSGSKRRMRAARSAVFDTR